MKELGYLFVEGYLFSLLYLVPLLGIYLVLNPKRVSVSPIIRYHKAILLLSIALPAIQAVVFYSVDLIASEDGRIHGRETSRLPIFADDSGLGPEGGVEDKNREPDED